MKTVALNLAAASPTGIQSFQDGDIFRESNIDLQAASLADALGYLRAQTDNAVLKTGNQTIAGNKTFSGTTTLSGPNALSGATTVSGALLATSTAEFDGQVNFDAACYVDENLYPSFANLPDANGAIDNIRVFYRVPQITANRVYTLPTGSASIVGRIHRFTRSRTADAFTVTMQDATGTVAIIDASAAGWVELECVDTSASGWRVSAWGGTVSSLRTTA
jgi:hypothetical protein